MSILSVWNVCTLSCSSIKQPAVEWTLDTVAKHPASYSQVGSHMWTVGIQKMSLAVFTPERNQV